MDAVEITSTLSFDMQDWYTGDPALVVVTVTDADTGDPVSGAVLIALVDENDLTEDEVTTTTDQNGRAAVSLTPTGVESHEVWVHFKEGTHEGYHLVAAPYIVARPPIELGKPSDPAPPPGEPEPLSASFNSTVNDLAVSVTGAASGGATPYTYQWDWGDGSTGAGENASHTYPATDTYTVTLTVMDTEGNTSSASQSLAVSAPGNPAPTPIMGQINFNFSEPNYSGTGATV